ncbi:MAG TPA: tetratricopeptide repeat protein, partial [Anaerolineales bacterium]|nr:tetratricopeptide repeat protein [Anaerolineales bacterium]
MDSFSAPDLPDSNAPYWIFSSAQYSEVESSVNMNVEETPKLSLPVHEVQGAKGVAMINPTPVNPHAREGEPIETEKVNSDSMNAHFWNDKGNLLFKRGAYEEAINAYNRSLQLDPSFGWPYSNLALTYLTQGQYAEAILLYQKSIDLLDSDKDRAISWNGLGNVYRCINDYANAVAAYQKAAELDPDTAGMRDGADTFQAGQTPKNSQTWNDLGELFLKTEAYDQAINAFQKAIDLDPQAGWPHSNLATALTWQGKYEEAIPLYEKSIRLLPNDKDKAFVWNRLGNVYRKLNNYDEAIKSYQKAVTLADEGVTLLTRTRFSLLSNVHAEQ